MTIEEKTLDYLMKHIPCNPPEIGGIMGGIQEIIKYIQIDVGIQQKCGCRYQPNTYILNKIIKEWSNNSIEFYGIFHTHFYGIETLSEGDKQYINKILLSMPNTIEKLYFPIIVIPEYKCIPYCAIRYKDTVLIKKEILKIKKENM